MINKSSHQRTNQLVKCYKTTGILPRPELTILIITAYNTKTMQ